MINDSKTLYYLKNKLVEVKEDYFYFLVAREIARNVYPMKQFLMIDELATKVNELETKTIAYLNSMLDDTELKYAQLELVFSKNIMDCLMMERLLVFVEVG